MSEIELHRKLLGDSVRNQALERALKKVIRPGKTVVADIGAGTGFISFLARRLGARHCHLYEYTPALNLARKLATRNGISGLTFVRAHSSEVRKPQQADVVVSETLGNYALEEHLLETLVDARRFLKPGGTILPCGLRQFVAPVVTPRLQDEIDVWRRVGFDLDLAEARAVSLNNMYVKAVRPEDLGGKAATGQVWDRMSFAPDDDAPASVRRSTVHWDAAAVAAATVHGFALWWEVEWVPGVTLSTSPFAPPTHWEQVYLPLLEPLALQAGDRLDLVLNSDTRPDAGIRVAWQARVLRGGKAVAEQKLDMRKGSL